MNHWIDWKAIIFKFDTLVSILTNDDIKYKTPCTGPLLTIPAPPLGYRNPHYKPRTIWRLSHVYNGNYHTNKTVSLYWKDAQMTLRMIYHSRPSLQKYKFPVVPSYIFKCFKATNGCLFGETCFPQGYLTHSYRPRWGIDATLCHQIDVNSIWRFVSIWEVSGIASQAFYTAAASCY